jgi:cobalamin biosynthesis protein CobW
VRAAHGSLPAAVILGLDAASQDDVHNRKTHHEMHHDDDEEHDHDEFENFVVETGAVSDWQNFISRLEPIIQAHDILRLKGFVQVENKPMRLVVQAVGSRVEPYFDRDWGPHEVPATRLVVIGLQGMDRNAIIHAIVSAIRSPDLSSKNSNVL